MVAGHRRYRFIWSRSCVSFVLIPAHSRMAFSCCSTAVTKYVSTQEYWARQPLFRSLAPSEWRSYPW